MIIISLLMSESTENVLHQFSSVWNNYL